jgi:RNA polymerase sigma-70 factor (ECF subfamily)
MRILGRAKLVAVNHNCGMLMTMLNEPSFRQLIERVRCGDQDAAAVLVEQFEPEIRREIRLRLTDAKLRRTVDSADISQSVLGVFFVRAALGQFELNKPEQLFGLLVRIARNKIVDRHRRQQKLNAVRQSRTAVAVNNHNEPIDPGASPSAIASGRDLMEQVQLRLTDDERELSRLRGQGKNWREIAELMGGEPEALRKRLARACDRVIVDFGLDV